MKRFVQRHLPALYHAMVNVAKRRAFGYRYHRRPDALAPIAFHTTGTHADDARLIDRVVTSYRLRAQEASIRGAAQWTDIFDEKHSETHTSIVGGNRARVERILRDPGSSDLFYGFDSLSRSLVRARRLDDAHAPALTLDALATVAEAVKARRLENPEDYRWGPTRRIAADEVIDQLERVFGFEIPVPNPFPGERGITSKRGVLSYRVPQALYQAWRIAQLTRGIPDPRVLEIGPGLGRTAYYARAFGIKDYTLIDVPISSFAQGYFLGRVLGEEHIHLWGETRESDLAAKRIKLLPPAAFLGGADHYDLVVNVDSMTELDESVARQYWAAIERRAGAFLSVNHESNPFTVGELIAKSELVANSIRMPYWLRRGYVEEVVHFRSNR